VAALHRGGFRNEVARIGAGIQRHAAHLHSSQHRTQGPRPHFPDQRGDDAGTQIRTEALRDRAAGLADLLLPDPGLLLRFACQLKEQSLARRAGLPLRDDAV
jgi:hypothetical protein